MINNNLCTPIFNESLNLSPKKLSLFCFNIDEKQLNVRIKDKSYFTGTLDETNLIDSDKINKLCTPNLCANEDYCKNPKNNFENQISDIESTFHPQNIKTFSTTIEKLAKKRKSTDILQDIYQDNIGQEYINKKKIKTSPESCSKEINSFFVSEKLTCIYSNEFSNKNSLNEKFLIKSDVFNKSDFLMPDYENMSTPILKDTLKKFGIKHLPKKQAIKKLTEIYEFTNKKKSKGIHRRSKSFSELPISITKNDDEICKKQKLIKKSESSQNIVSVEQPSSENDKFIVKINSKERKEKKLITDSALKSIVNDTINNDVNLFQSILNYEPIKYDEFFHFLQVKSKPSKISSQSLMKVLDDFGVTFTLKNSKKNTAK